MLHSKTMARSFPEPPALNDSRCEVAQPGADLVEQTNLDDAFAPAWSVIVWNDPINLMSYVVHVFRQVLGFDEPTATRHMLEVHHLGRSCVARETREKAEFYWQQLKKRGLQTTIEPLD